MAHQAINWIFKLLIRSGQVGSIFMQRRETTFETAESGWCFTPSVLRKDDIAFSKDNKPVI